MGNADIGALHRDEGSHTRFLADADLARHDHLLFWDVRQHALQSAEHISAFERRVLGLSEEPTGARVVTDGRDLASADLANRQESLTAQNSSVLHPAFSPPQGKSATPKTWMTRIQDVLLRRISFSSQTGELRKTLLT